MQELYEKIYQSDKFKQLEKERSIFSWKLSCCVFLIYFSFILTVAFKPELLSIPIASNSVISIGVPIGILIIVISFILTGVYTRRANNQFDVRIQTIIKEAEEGNEQ